MKTCKYCGTPRTKKRFSLSTEKCDFCIMKELAKEELLANRKTEYPPPNPTLVEKRRRIEKAKELKEIDEDLEI